jgi:hypothetical protein
MSESKEPKVTECWAQIALDKRFPCAGAVSYDKEVVSDRPAILLWREDYDALLKEREELRKRCRYNLDPGAQITCWDEYESLRARYNAMRKELEELMEWRKAVKGGYQGV